MLAIAEAELPEMKVPVPVNENFIDSIFSEKPSGHVIYVRSDLPVTIKGYNDGLPVLMKNAIKSSLAFLYSQFTNNTYNKGRRKLPDSDRRNVTMD